MNDGRGFWISSADVGLLVFCQGKTTAATRARAFSVAKRTVIFNWQHMTQPQGGEGVETRLKARSIRSEVRQGARNDAFLTDV